jgi:hypothetical protein
MSSSSLSSSFLVEGTHVGTETVTWIGGVELTLNALSGEIDIESQEEKTESGIADTTGGLTLLTTFDDESFDSVV